MSRVHLLEQQGIGNSDIPLIEEEWESLLLGRCATYGTLASLPSRTFAGTIDDATKQGGHLVGIAPTAYNYLGAIREPAIGHSHGHSSLSRLAWLQFGSADEADYAYAMLSSGLAFWMWRVYGDGFHATSRVWQSLPLLPASSRAMIAALGNELWSTVSQSPIVSVNKGRTTVSFSSLTDVTTRNAIDDEIGQTMQFAYRADLGRWYTNVVDVGRFPDPRESSELDARSDQSTARSERHLEGRVA